MSKELVLKTLKEIRAFQDPYRQQIIRVLDRLGRPATAKQIADILGEPPSKVHYHVKVLEDHKILTLSHTENVNGIIARFMEITHDSIKILRPEDDKGRDEVYSMIENRFDDMKYNFISRLKEIPTRCEGEGANGILKSGTIYMTEEEAKELEFFIEERTRKSRQFQNDENYCGWDVYMAMVRIKK
ncbi:MAG: helix-turn-helix transcriptional regulator [Clostridia bacterium]|nr:helix-turn-helix transcriptional regulator [Clostridia bacterium]